MTTFEIKKLPRTVLYSVYLPPGRFCRAVHQMKDGTVIEIGERTLLRHRFAHRCSFDFALKYSQPADQKENLNEIKQS